MKTRLTHDPFADSRRRFVKLGGSLFLAPFLGACSTLESIDRGLLSINESMTKKDRVTGNRQLDFSPSREKQIRESDAAIREYLSRYSYFNEPYSTYSRLEQIFWRVHAISHFADEDWKVVMVPEPSFNAFVNGGTYVVVHAGLMNELSSDDEVAVVIGHEIGHVAANHAYENQVEIMSLLRGKSGDGVAYTYNTIKEDEADKIGILYASLAGYDPYAATRIWSRFGQTPWQYFRTHPANSDRARSTIHIASQVSQYRVAGSINPNHQDILDCNALWCK